MLYIANKLSQLSFGKLMSIYIEANQEHGAELAPEEPLARQIMLSEQDFYSYLDDVFFLHKEARYAIWIEEEKYVSALRLEPFQEGLLLEALETAPEERRKGYAAKLIQAVLDNETNHVIYSHVSKNNTPSLRTHLKCGFEVWKDYSVYIDGSVNNRAYTMRWKK